MALATCLISYYFLRKKVARKVILTVFILFLAGYGIRLFFLLRNPLIYGIDGPWYVAQVKSTVETGAPSAAGVEPLALYFAGGASVFVNDATLGIKITQAFFSALPTLTTWLLAFYITKNNLASFAAALLTTFSAMSMILTDVLRNTCAFAFLPLFYLFFFKFVKGEGREWVVKTPLKIRGGKLDLTLNINLILSLLVFLLILGFHFLTAGFAVMTVIAYVAFFTGYRRKIPWRELKFVAVLGILMLVGMAASGHVRDKIINTSNDIATSDPVPADMFPFFGLVSTPGGEIAERGVGTLMLFLPFILIALPAMWFTLRHSDRRCLLFTATIPLTLLCAQNWVVNYMYGARFLVMMCPALFVLVGISLCYPGKSSTLRKSPKKVTPAVFAVAFVFFSLMPFVGAGILLPNTSQITLEEWTELRPIGENLPENSIVTAPAEMELVYWGPLLFDKESGSTFFLQGGGTLWSIAEGMKGTQEPGMISLAVVQNDLVAGQNLQSFGLEFYDNVRTENYCVIKLIENASILDNSDNTGSFSSFDSDGATSSVVSFSSSPDPSGVINNMPIPGTGPGGLPEYPGAVDLQWSKEDIQENHFQGNVDLSDNNVLAAIYSATDNYTNVSNWYREQMSGLGWTNFWYDENQAGHWTYHNYTKGSDMAIISVTLGGEGSTIVLTEGPASAVGGSFGWPSLQGGAPPSGPFHEPAATNEIRFNHNPLFAFILLPIELVQALYGTALYGILKLVIAIPLSVGIIGFLIGLCPILANRYRKWRKTPHKAKPSKRRT